MSISRKQKRAAHGCSSFCLLFLALFPYFLGVGYESFGFFCPEESWIEAVGSQAEAVEGVGVLEYFIKENLVLERRFLLFHGFDAEGIVPVVKAHDVEYALIEGKTAFFAVFPVICSGSVAVAGIVAVFHAAESWKTEAAPRASRSS